MKRRQYHEKVHLRFFGGVLGHFSFLPCLGGRRSGSADHQAGIPWAGNRCQRNLMGRGDNSKGELDDIGSGDRLDPWTGPYQTTPIKLMEGVAAVSAGVYTLTLKTDGTLWSRGQGEDWSQLLDGVTAIDQGGGNYAAIKKDGSLWLWGDNRFGQLAPGGGERGSCRSTG